MGWGEVWKNLLGKDNRKKDQLTLWGTCQVQWSRELHLQTCATLPSYMRPEEEKQKIDAPFSSNKFSSVGKVVSL